MPSERDDDWYRSGSGGISQAAEGANLSRGPGGVADGHPAHTGVAAFGFKAGLADPAILAPESIWVALAQARIDPAVAVIAGLVLPLIMLTAIGAVMIWKRPADPMVLLTSLMLITVMAAFSKSSFAAMSTMPGLAGVVRAGFFVAFGSFVLVFALFPNGRSVPTRAWMLAPVLAATFLVLPEVPRALAMFPDRPADFSKVTWTLDLTFVMVVLSLAVVWQVYRYRERSTPTERLQVKWVILPLGLVVSQLFLMFILSQPVFALGAWTGWAQLSLIPTSLALPVGVAAAILKYRLYDIERIVSRTVTYGVLTVLLFGIYATLVFGLRQLMPMQGDVAVAGSTLGVAALANPLRHRIQRAVDRRFNRTHSDAARTLSEFTDTLRRATDLEAVALQLHQAVDRTFQPERLSFWVRSR